MKRSWMLILTSVSGNGLEWYDFALYGYFAPVLAKLFFPLENTFVSLMVTLGVFASGFIVRPVGGIVFGHIGDKYGRKKALVFSIALITLPTTLMGLLPTYATAGIAAPILLTMARLFQGLAVSGELTGSGAFLVESAPANSRGIYGSLIMCSTYLGLVIGSGISALVTMIFSSAQIAAYAWRIPFLLSSLMGILALILRLKCEESPLFLQASLKNKLLEMPIKDVFRRYLSETVLICFLGSSLAVGIYLIIGYLPTFFVYKAKVSLELSMCISFISLFALTVLVPIVGFLSDRYDRKKILGIGAAGFLFFSYFIFSLMQAGKLGSIILAEFLIIIFISLIAGSIITSLTEILPTNVRYTGISLGYNTSMALFGGTTPLITVYLTKTFNSPIAPALYLGLCGIITILSLMKVKLDGAANMV